jgi:hypothetical protein
MFSILARLPHQINCILPLPRPFLNGFVFDRHTNCTLFLDASGKKQSRRISALQTAAANGIV